MVLSTRGGIVAGRAGGKSATARIRKIGAQRTMETSPECLDAACSNAPCRAHAPKNPRRSNASRPVISTSVPCLRRSSQNCCRPRARQTHYNIRVTNSRCLRRLRYAHSSDSGKRLIEALAVDVGPWSAAQKSWSSARPAYGPIACEQRICGVLPQLQQSGLCAAALVRVAM